MGGVELKEFTRTGFDGANRVEETGRVADWPLAESLGVKKIGGTPRLFWAKSAQTIGKMGDRFCSFARERKREARARKSEGTAWGAIRRHRQSRWLSKERGCGRGKMDRCQNKGDSKSCPDLGAKEWIE